MTREVMAPTPTMHPSLLEQRRAAYWALPREAIVRLYLARPGYTNTETLLSTEALIEILAFDEPIAFTGADGDLVE